MERANKLDDDIVFTFNLQKRKITHKHLSKQLQKLFQLRQHSF